MTLKKRGRPRKPMLSADQTIGEALEDVRQGLQVVSHALTDLHIRVGKLREILAIKEQA